MTVAARHFPAGGILLAGIGAFFLFVRPPLLPVAAGAKGGHARP